MKLTHPPQRDGGGRRRRLPAVIAGTAVLAFGLVAVASSPAFAAVAAAPTGIDRVVSLSGTIDSTCGAGIAGSTPVYTSVQAAVDAAAGGEQIYVCAGTYVENVAVTTGNIDLLGTNWNDPTGASDASVIRAASSGSPVVNFGAASPFFNGVRGFTLEDGTYGVRSEATSGCCWSDASTEGIRNNVITGSTVAGIETNGIDTGLISGNDISPAANADGIRTYDAAGALTIEANTITLAGTGVGITARQTGILVIDTTPGGVLVDGSTVQFNQISGTSGDGVLIEGTVASTNVYDNTITDAGGAGVRVHNGSSVVDATSIRIQRNTVTDPAGDGVSIEGYATDVYVGGASAGNTITGAGGDGVSVVGVVETAGDQLARTLSVGVVYVTANSITAPTGDGVHFENTETAYPSNNAITGAGGDGIDATLTDYVSAYSNTITGSAGDGIHAQDVGNGVLSQNTITGNAGDGIELTANTSAMTVTLNTVNQNASGVRITSPTVRAPSFVGDNNLAQNTGYACEDQSSGTISNPPATGTQGNDWTATNSGASLQAPEGICGATLVATAGLADGVVGTSYSDSVSASGAPGPYTWYSTALPAGLTLDTATGAITGTPTQAVTELPVTFWVVSAGGVWGQVSDAITITTASGMTADATLPDGTVGAPYTSPTPTVSGGTGPYTWSATGLPAGLSIDPATGIVSGTPTVGVADQPVTITVTDSLGETVDIPLTITILPEDPGVPMSHPLVAGVGIALGLALLAMQRRRRAIA